MTVPHGLGFSFRGIIRQFRAWRNNAAENGHWANPEVLLLPWDSGDLRRQEAWNQQLAKVHCTWSGSVAASVIFPPVGPEDRVAGMATFPKVHSSIRAPRTTFPTPEPADFRVEDKLLKGSLRRLSLTGGCALLGKQVKTGTLAEIAIPTPLGPVIGLIEFLGSGAKQPAGSEFGFRFVAFDEEHHDRLTKALHQFG